MTDQERLSPLRRLAIAAVFLVAGAIGFAGGRVSLRPSHAVTQPISFNHRLHVEEAEIECETCHEYVRSGEHAGLPSLTICADCHDDAESESAAERRLVALIQDSPDESFRKLFQMPDHVYYTHRRHVGIAELECASCHGEIAATTATPERPLMRVTMDGCIDCHRQRDVESSCTDCHR